VRRIRKRKIKIKSRPKNKILKEQFTPRSSP